MYMEDKPVDAIGDDSSDAGSIPAASTKMCGDVAQLGRAPALHTGGWRFKSARLHQLGVAQW